MIELADLLGHSAYELLALSLLCWLLSHAVRFYALKANVVDVPGERSSHSQVTPRGGGLAIVITAIIAAVIQWHSAPAAESTQPWLLAIYLPAGILGLISFIDDHKPLSRRLRIMVHLFCAGLLLYLLPSTVYLPIGDYSLDISAWWLLPISLIAIGWLINLYNFMDGIDGIAASEGISMLFGLSLIIYLQNGQLDSQLLALSAILIGFLCINWAPAKLFMGDIGSCFLGLALFACACYCSAQYQINLWASMILLAAFITDASWTLIHRILSGQAWNEPHRSHSYQILSRRWHSHSLAVCAMLVINILWLLPLAIFATYKPTWAAALFIVACLPFMTIGHRIKAGHSATL